MTAWDKFVTKVNLLIQLFVNDYEKTLLSPTHYKTAALEIDYGIFSYNIFSFKNKTNICFKCTKWFKRCVFPPFFKMSLLMNSLKGLK